MAVKQSGFSAGKLLALNSQTLATTASVNLVDPGSHNTASLTNSSTASPMVGPDGDVYFGVLENPFPYNHDRGWMLHFDATLGQLKTPGAFGWDDTASVVPAAMLPNYTGPSTYLLMVKYNNYASRGGDGVNKIAILDPNVTMTDPITGATVMNEVMTIAGPTPDQEFLDTHPNAVREWCINTAVVDPATCSVLANSEDGKLYRWDLDTNTLSQVVTLTRGIGEAYTPTLIGPSGLVYAINGATIFAVGAALPTVDNGDTSYHQTSGWRQGGLAGGFQGDYRYADPGTGDRSARWDFSGLPGGLYQVLTTYVPSSNRASNAPYAILDGSRHVV